MQMNTPYIFGCKATVLTKEEKNFFTLVKPFGFILFQRNCNDKEQLKQLILDLQECVEHHAPVLIDQEGGKVQRLKPPVWRDAIAAEIFGSIFRKKPDLACKLATANARLIAEDLYQIGVNVNCSPVLDLKELNAHSIIGSRAFSSDPYAVSQLGKAVVKGLKEGGIAPIMKHIPGHGRAQVDSHYSLPTVDAEFSDLKERDFKPFYLLNECSAAMTGHLLFSKIDAIYPVTLSKIVIKEIIRENIGFHGLLISDDLSMAALSGSLRQRGSEALRAGCDVVLHCNGQLDEMKNLIGDGKEFSSAAKNRAQIFLNEMSDLKTKRKNINYKELITWLDYELTAFI
jgi:beta-N-acetylhexosaminidase